MILEVELREVREDLADLELLSERLDEEGGRPTELDRIIARMEDRRAKLWLARRKLFEEEPEPELTDIDPIMTFDDIADLMKDLLKRGGE